MKVLKNPEDLCLRGNFDMKFDWIMEMSKYTLVGMVNGSRYLRLRGMEAYNYSGNEEL